MVVRRTDNDRLGRGRSFLIGIFHINDPARTDVIVSHRFFVVVTVPVRDGRSNDASNETSNE